MRQNELIVYRNMEDGGLLQDMAWLMTYYRESPLQTEEGRPCTPEGKKELFCDCIHRLIELAGRYGFHGNLWHCCIHINGRQSILELCTYRFGKCRQLYDH